MSSERKFGNSSGKKGGKEAGFLHLQLESCLDSHSEVRTM